MKEELDKLINKYAKFEYIKKSYNDKGEEVLTALDRDNFRDIISSYIGAKSPGTEAIRTAMASFYVSTKVNLID